MIYKKIFQSPLGEICISSDGEYLTAVCFKESDEYKKYSISGEEVDLPIFKETIKWFDIYCKGENPNFIPKYKINGLTPFREGVINELNKIPYGTTITYNDIAKTIAKKRGIKKMSAQAVGGAVGWNPICVIIPCHRVIGANNNLTGYGGGMENKVKLLELEGNVVDKLFIIKNGEKNG